MAEAVTSKRQTRRLWTDAVIALVGVVATAVLLISFDAFEAFHEYSRNHEEWELDDLVMTAAVASLWIAWFAWRQWRLARDRLHLLAKAEDALGQSDDKLEFLIAAAPGTFYVREPQKDGQIVYVSPHVKEQLGVDPEDICRKPYAWIDSLHPDDRDKIQVLRETTLSEGRACEEFRFRHADGRYRWMENHTVLLRNQNGEPEAVVGYIHDTDVQKQFSQELTAAVNARTAELSATNRVLEREIAERQTVAAKLRLEQERSARLIANLPGYVYVRNCGGKDNLRFISSGVQRILGYEPSTLIGENAMDLMDVVHPDDRKMLRQAGETLLQLGEAFECEYRVRAADGEERWLWERMRGVVSPSGQLIRIEGYVEDITERKEIDQALRTSLDRLDIVTNNLPFLVGYADKQGRMLFGNKIWQEWAQKPAEEMVGRKIADIAKPENYAEIAGMVEDALAGKRTSAEGPAYFADGEEHMVYRDYIPHFTPDGEPDGFVLLVRDISEEKQFEEEKRLYSERLEQATEVAGLGYYVWDVLADRCIFCSEEHARLHDLSAEEYIARAATMEEEFSLVHPEDRAFVKERLQAMRNGEKVAFEYRIRLDDGAVRHVSEIIHPLFDDSGQVIREIGTSREITDEKRAQQAIEENRRRLKTAAKMAKLGHFVWDLVDDRCLYCSEELAQLHGLSVEEYMERAIGVESEANDFLHPDDRERYLEALRDTYDNQKPLNIEYRIVTAEGDVRHMREIEHIFLVENGVPLRSEGTVQDITDIRQKEDSLAESERRLKSAAEMARLGHYVWDLVEDRCLYCSDEFARMHGMTAADYIAASTRASEDAERFVHPDDLERYKEKLRRTDEEQKPLNIEYRMITADGEVRYVREIEHRVEIADGRMLRSEGTVQDITDIRHTEDSLAESERRLKTAAQMAKLGHFVWDLQADRYITCSEELAALHGLSVEAYLKRANGVETEANAFVHPDDRERYLDALRDGYEKRQPLSIEYRIIDANGDVRHVREIEHSFIVENGIARRSEGIVQDITEIKLAAQQLQQAQKMEAVGQLTGGLAHDFNNLLTVILGNLQLLERRIVDDERATKRIDTAKHAAQRGAELTRSLLAFSRQQPLEEQPTDLSEAVSEMNRLLKTSVGEQIELDFFLDQDLSPARVDPGQLETALLNLILNARDAMPDGGRVTIQTEAADLDAEHAAQKPDMTPGRYVVLSVTDNGSGMSPETQQRIFEPFFTTKEVGQGSGLGLSMVFGFVKQSGGHVTVYSEEGQGTCFSLYFPVDDSESAETAKEQVGTFCPLGRETILVVEDQEDVRETSLATLSGLGYRVLSAENGPSALAVLKEHPDIDLLFTDIAMPEGMNGLELADRAVRERPQLRVLYTSGFPPASVSRMRDPERGRNWLTKPYLNQTLAQKVREVLDRSQSD